MPFQQRFQPRAMLRLAMAGLLAFYAVPIVITRYWAGLSVDVLDGIRGLLLGVVLGLLMVYLVARRRQRLT